MNRDSWQAVRAVFLAAIMIISVFAAGIALGESAAADRSPASDGVLTVAADGSAEFETIQAAIDHGDSSDIVRVESGTYDESVTVDVEGLTLEGPNADLAGDSGNRGDEATITQGIQITADGVTVDGFDVTTDDADTSTNNGILLGTDAVPSDVTVTNNIVRDISGSGSGGDKSAANGINLQFNGAFEQTSTGVSITDNLITRITTRGGNSDEDAIGIQALPRGNDIEDLRITGNTIEDIEPSDAAGGDPRSEARAVSIATQFTDTPRGDSDRGDLGQVSGLVVENNNISGLNADFARAITLFEGSDSSGDTVGPVNFTITGNNISGVDSTGKFFDLALFVGEYGDFGDDHSVRNNDFDAAGIQNFGDSDALSTGRNTFSGSTDAYYVTASNIDSVFDDNTFLPEVVVGNTAITRLPVKGEVLNVDQLASFQSVQTAVSEANPGDTISVGPGTFNESVTIDTEGLTLRGADGASPTIIGQSSITVTSTAPNVEIADLRIKNPDGSRAVRVTDNATGVVIQNNTVANVNTNNNADQPRGIVVGGLDGGDSADGLEIRNNTVTNVEGGAADKDQAHAIQILEESGGGGLIENVVVDGNTIESITDTRSTAAVQFNGKIEGEITNNNISGLNTEGNPDDVDPGGGFTQVIALTKGDNAADGPQNVAIEGNDISDIETTAPEEAINFAPPFHIHIGEDADAETISIENNDFSADSVDPGGDVYVGGNTGGLNLDAILNDQGNTFDRAVAIENETGTLQTSIGSSVQFAVDQASPGDTISVGPGTFNESVTIDTEDVTVEGPNAGIAGDSDQRGDESIITSGLTIAADGVTIDGVQIENADRDGIRFGPDTVPSNVTIQNSVVTNVTGDTGGKAAANGIQFFFGGVANETAKNVRILDNEISDISAPDTGQNESDAIGVNVLPRGNDIVNLRIAGNTIENISVGDSSGRSEARGISIGTQFENTSDGSRGNFGQAIGLTVENNNISNLESDFTRAIALFEDKKGAAKTSDKPVGPVNFTIIGNNISGVNSEANFFDAAIFIGEYGNFGNGHIVQNNNFTGATVQNFNDSDALNTTGNTFSGDPKGDIHYTAADADVDSIINSNTFNRRVTIRDASGNVTGDTIFAGIQPAIDGVPPAVNAISSGETVVVGPGIYSGNLTIDTANITLKSAADADNTEIQYGGNDRNPTINIAASDVTVDNFTIERINGDKNSQGVAIRATEDVTVENNIITQSGDASQPVQGILVTDNNGDRSVTTDTVIGGNEISGFDHGIAISTQNTTSGGISGAFIDDNTIQNNVIGIKISDFNDTDEEISATVTGNEISSNEDGIRVLDDSDAGPAGTEPEGSANLSGFVVERNNIVDNTNSGITHEASADDNSIDASLNWWGNASGPNADSANDVEDDGTPGEELVAHDPFLTAPIEDIEVDDVGDTKQFAQDVIAPADQDVTAVGFPGPVPQGYTVGDAFEDVEGGAIFEYDRQEGEFNHVNGSEEISALDAFVITQNSNISDEDTQVVIEYANDLSVQPSVTIGSGFNLVAAPKLGDSSVVFNSPNEREVIYGTYGFPSDRSETALLSTEEASDRFVQFAFGPGRDNVVTPYGGYLIFSEDRRQIPGAVRGGATADEVINTLELNQTAT